MFVIKRLLFVLLVVWSASTITFFIPRISDINPIRERFAELARLGGFSAGELEKIVESYSLEWSALFLLVRATSLHCQIGKGPGCRQPPSTFL